MPSMMLGYLVDHEIEALSDPERVSHPMIVPFIDRDNVDKALGGVTRGLSHTGYDPTLASALKVWHANPTRLRLWRLLGLWRRLAERIRSGLRRHERLGRLVDRLGILRCPAWSDRLYHGCVVDLENLDIGPQPELVEIDDLGYYDLPPGSFALGVTVERFHLPADVKATIVGKSTWLRLGVDVKVSEAETGWAGWLTVEIQNMMPWPVRIRKSGICQMMFYRVSQRPSVTYSDDGGRYDNQPAEPTLPRLARKSRTAAVKPHWVA